MENVVVGSKARFLSSFLRNIESVHNSGSGQPMVANEEQSIIEQEESLNESEIDRKML